MDPMNQPGTSGAPTGGAVGSNSNDAADQRAADTAAAVADVLKETGADRDVLEGRKAPDAAPSKPTTPVKPPVTSKPATPATPADGKPADGKPAANDAAATPAADGKPAAAAPTEEEDLDLSAEELGEIEKNPLLRRVYKNIQRAMTKKAMALADERKALASDADILAKLRANPAVGIAALAQAAGLQVSINGQPAQAPSASTTPAAPAKSPLEEAIAEFGKAFTPEASAVITPIFAKLAKAIAAEENAALRHELDELRPQVSSVVHSNTEARLGNELAEFGRMVTGRGDDWNDDIIRAMSEVISAKRVMPGQGTTLNDYLGLVYDHVTSARSRTAQRERQIARLRTARQAGGEPTHAARQDPAPNILEKKITADMSDADAVALAAQQAMAELGIQ